MTKNEALKLALEFIERVNKDGWILADFEPEMYATITAIKEALAQTQEPVAWYHAEDYKTHFTTNPSPDLIGKYWKPLYTHPPQRTWVGLTQDELNMIGDSMRTWNSHSLTDVYVAIEAKLKERNT
jgi:hypothetical protein